MSKAPEEATTAAADGGDLETAAAGDATATVTDPQVTGAEENVSREFPFAIDGKTGTMACVPSAPNTCTGLPLGTDSEGTFEPLVFEGTPTHVAATLTWTATTPASQEMYVNVFALRSCGDGCMEWDDEMFSAFASGTSPVTLDASGITLREGESLYIHTGRVDPLPDTPSPVFMFYSVEQAFHLEGLVHALAAPLH